MASEEYVLGPFGTGEWYETATFASNTACATCALQQLVRTRAMSEMHKSTSTNAFAVSMGSLASFQSHLTSEQEAACAHRPLPGMAVDSAPPGFRSAAAANGFRLSSIANGTTCHDHPAHPLPLSLGDLCFL